MIASSLPASLKPYKKYFTRADELGAAGEIVVAYACKMHVLVAVMKRMGEQAFPQEQKAEIEGFAMRLMQELETQKKSGLDAKGAEAATMRIAEQEFTTADTRDRASQWDKATASGFNNANILFEVLEQYGKLSVEVSKKKDYAEARAQLLVKSLQTGTPPPPPSGQSSGGAAGGAAPAAQPSADANESNMMPPGMECNKQEKKAVKRDYEPVARGQPKNPVWDEPRHRLNQSSSSEDYKSEARRQAQFGASALMFQDIETALRCTDTAVQLLRAAGITPAT